MTYSAPLYVDIKKTALTASGVEDPTEADWQPIKDENGNEPDREEQKVWIGKVSPAISDRYRVSSLDIGPNYDTIELLSVE